MKFLVTGAAGFIGSQVVKNLLSRNYTVRGIDCFLDRINTELYQLKKSRILPFIEDSHFSFIECDLAAGYIIPYFSGYDVVIHLAAVPGPRLGWNEDFDKYARNNVLVTQRVLDASRKAGVGTVVFASSSSVYGNTDGSPSREDDKLNPISPYGVTKLAGEHLCRVYADSFGLNVRVLRYFTVIGTNPRPDMAHTIFAEAILKGEMIKIFGDGKQSRSFTHIYDAVDATVAAATCLLPWKYTVFNIGGFETVTVNELIERLEFIMEEKAKVVYTDRLTGDPRFTCPDISNARKYLDYNPHWTLSHALRQVVESVRHPCVL